MICWTMGQQAFNAAMILTLSLLNPSPTSPSSGAATASRDDYYLVHRTYATFVEMHHKGIHRLAGVACTKLSGLLMQLHPAPSSAGFGQPAPPREAMDSVMGGTGMMLLEDPGLQGFVEDAFAPLGFQMAGGELPPRGMGGDSYPTANVDTAGAGAEMNMNVGMGMGMGIGSPGWAARPAPAIPSTSTSAMMAGPSSAMGGGGSGGDSARPPLPGMYGAGLMMMSGGNPGITSSFGGGGGGGRVFNRSGSDSGSGSGGSRAERPQVGPKPEMFRMPSGSRA